MLNACPLQANEKIVLPFHNADGFILINGSVNGHTGKLMLDTATPFNYLVNDNFVGLLRDVFFGSGHVSSGQSITIFEHNSPVAINLFYGMFESKSDKIKHADLSFIENGITSDFLGMIGHHFLYDKVFKIDYDNQNITFYDQLMDAISDASTIEITLHGDDMSLPYSIFNIDGVEIQGFFDTGSQGLLELTEELEGELIAANYLELLTFNGIYGEPISPGVIKLASLTGLNYESTLLRTISALKYQRSNINRISLGYQFLRNYKSIWALTNKNIFLVK